MSCTLGSASLWWFFVRSVGLFLLLTLLWVPISPWTSHPAAGLAHIILGNGAKNWVSKINKSPGQFEVEIRILKATSSASGTGLAEVVAEAKPANYAYGLPLFLALLLAARSKHLIRRAAAGYLILLLPQTFSLIFGVLREIIAVAGGPAALGIVNWQMQGIVLCGMAGSLLLPTLAPVALWLWFDRVFFAAVVMDGWLRRSAETLECPKQPLE